MCMCRDQFRLVGFRGRDLYIGSFGDPIEPQGLPFLFLFFVHGIVGAAPIGFWAKDVFRPGLAGR